MKNSRIKAESKFQNQRESEGGSPRKFQHLIREEHPFLLSQLGDVKNKRILTMGCATGGVTPFARQGAIILGVDISLEALSTLSWAIQDEGLIQYAEVAQMDSENLALKDGCFDIVLFIGVLHHLDVEKAMAESYRVLKPNGKVFMSEPLGLHPLVNLYRMITPKARTKFEHPLRPKDFKTIKKYFKIELFESFCLTSVLSLGFLYAFRSEKLYEWARRVFISIDTALFKVFPFLKYLAWSSVVVCKK